MNLLNDVNCIASELKKQESLLSQIHHDMNAGFVTKEREEQLWDVQRIITQLKRKLRSFQKSSDKIEDSERERRESITEPVEESPEMAMEVETKSETKPETVEITEEVEQVEQQQPGQTATPPIKLSTICDDDKNILLLQFQNSELIELQTYLLTQLQIEKNEIIQLKKNIIEGNVTQTETNGLDEDSHQFDKFIDLLMRENMILNIKKNNLIRELMEQREECVNLQSQLLFIALSQG